jgi:hypothetical protein
MENEVKSKYYETVVKDANCRLMTSSCLKVEENEPKQAQSILCIFALPEARYGEVFTLRRTLKIGTETPRAQRKSLRTT